MLHVVVFPYEGKTSVIFTEQPDTTDQLNKICVFRFGAEVVFRWQKLP